MKTFSVLALALTLVTAAAPAARAQAFGQFTTAETIPVSGHLFGGYLTASENVLGLMAQLRLSFYEGIDFGFQGGLTRIDLAGSDVTTVRVGGDMKFQVARAGDSYPVDLALGGALGLEAGDDINTLAIGPTMAASRRLALGGSTEFVPYAGIGLLFTRTEVGDFDENRIVVPLRFGGEMRFTQEFRLIAEFQIPINDDFNDNLGMAFGVNLPF